MCVGRECRWGRGVCVVVAIKSCHTDVLAEKAKFQIMIAGR